MTVQEARESQIAYVGLPDIPVGMTVRDYCRSRSARDRDRAGRLALARYLGRPRRQGRPQ